MLIPEQLFSLPLAKDRATQQFELVRRSITTGPAFGSTNLLTDLYTMPGDRVGVVAGWGMQLVRNGGLAIVRSASQYLYSENTNIQYFQGQITAAFGANFQYLGGPGGVWVGPGIIVGVASSVDVVDVNTIFTHHLQLLTFPRGNISLS